MSAPNTWFPYKRCGDIIEGTRLISFKVPLKETISNGFDKDERFTPTLLIRMIEEMGKKLGMVIDLTFTLKYYKPEEFQRFGVEYFKLKTEGHMVPSEDVYRKFSEVISSYLERNKDNDHLIGVHCTHGVNRTGYLICRYMIETMSFSAEDAISAFNKARRHHIERQNYIDDLKTRPRRDSNTSINEQCNKQSSSKPEGAKHYFKEKKRSDSIIDTYKQHHNINNSSKVGSAGSHLWRYNNKLPNWKSSHHHRPEPTYGRYSQQQYGSNSHVGINGYNYGTSNTNKQLHSRDYGFNDCSSLPLHRYYYQTNRFNFFNKSVDSSLPKVNKHIFFDDTDDSDDKTVSKRKSQESNQLKYKKKKRKKIINP